MSPYPYPCNEILFDLTATLPQHLAGWNKPTLRFRRWTVAGSCYRCEDCVTSDCSRSLREWFYQKGHQTQYSGARCLALPLSTDRWEHFDYILKLNHGVFHASQGLVIVVTSLSPFQTNPRTNLRPRRSKMASQTRSPRPFYRSQLYFAQNFRKWFTCGRSSRLGGPQGDAFSYRRH